MGLVNFLEPMMGVVCHVPWLPQKQQDPLYEQQRAIRCAHMPHNCVRILCQILQPSSVFQQS